MIGQNIGLILYITGGATALMILQFLLPQLMIEKVNKLKINENAGRFYAQHWGLVVFSVGALLIYAGRYPVHRDPIILAALIEKAGLVLLLLADFKKSYAKKLRLPMVFDLVCITLYTLYFLKV